MGRCPACGRGPLFQGFLKRRAVCEACGYELGAVETGDGAATFIMQIAGFLVGFSALAVEIAWSPPIITGYRRSLKSRANSPRFVGETRPSRRLEPMPPRRRRLPRL